MKFTRTLLAVSLFTAAQLVTAQTEKPDAFVQQLLEKQYPHNEKALKAFNENKEGEEAIKQCYFKDLKEPQDKDALINGYCMNFVSEKIVDAPQGKRRYVFFSGDNLNHAHVMSGLDALFIFTSIDGKDWSALTRKETYAVGGWGQATGEIKWLETGPGLWGVMSEGGYTQGGATEGSTHILHDDGKEIREAAIPTYIDTTAMADCNDAEYLQETNKNEADCYARNISLEGTIEIRKDLPAMGNTYPLQVTINGHEGLKLVGKGKNARTQPIKEYKNEKFLFSYNPDKHEYVMPADYPKSLRPFDDMDNAGNQ